MLRSYSWEGMRLRRCGTVREPGFTPLPCHFCLELSKRTTFCEPLFSQLGKGVRIQTYLFASENSAGTGGCWRKNAVLSERVERKGSSHGQGRSHFLVVIRKGLERPGSWMLSGSAPPWLCGQLHLSVH